MYSRWDIFCRIVDNYGDIGVCWRLARQLADEHGLSVRLWVDDLATARRLIPGLDPNLHRQTIAAVELCHWCEPFTETNCADVVIEAFACDLPPVYLSAMAQRKPLWINLEYLSAEPWVADCHLRASPQPQLGLSKTYFFPGFDASTGGLLREQDLLQRRDAFQRDSRVQQDFWRQLGVPLPVGPALKISLFCYPTAPVGPLLDHLTQAARPVLLLVTENGLLNDIAARFGLPSTAAGSSCQHDNLTLQVIPFLSQPDYDRLLWACDLNFVRGEDSWVRALWAGRPMLWQPYVQAEDTHLRKLQAWLDIAYAELPASAGQVVRDCHLYWSGAGLQQADWPAYLSRLGELDGHAMRLSARQASVPDLTAKLVIFCKNYF